MRIFKRLFPVLALVLLTAMVLARPAGPIGFNRNPGQQSVQPQVNFGLGNPPNPKLYFGTVVRDTADEQGVGYHEIPSGLKVQDAPYLPFWLSFIVQSWVGTLLAVR